MAKLSASVYDTIDAVDTNQWNQVVEQSDRGSIYQRTGWIAAVERGLSLDGKHIVVEKAGNPIGVFPNVIASVRLPDSVRARIPGSLFDQAGELASTRPGLGGPVLTGHERDALSLALDRLEEISGPRILSHYVSVPGMDYVRYAEQLEARGYTPNVSRCRPVIDLNQEYDDILDNMHKDRRYNLRKARENDATVFAQSPTTDVLEAFYSTYEETMDRVGAKPQPRTIFHEIVELLSDSVRIVAAEVDGDTVGQHLYLLDSAQGTVRHEFSAVSADDFEYYPSELIHEHTMQWALTEGYDTYDFGPTPSNHEDGLFSYKHQYGGTPIPILTWERGQSPLWWAYRNARRLYKYYG